MLRVIDAFCRAVTALMAVALMAMVVLVFGNVVLRYGFNSSITVSEELLALAFRVLVFKGALEQTRINMDVCRGDHSADVDLNVHEHAARGAGPRRRVAVEGSRIPKQYAFVCLLVAGQSELARSKPQARPGINSIVVRHARLRTTARATDAA